MDFLAPSTGARQARDVNSGMTFTDVYASSRRPPPTRMHESTPLEALTMDRNAIRPSRRREGDGAEVVCYSDNGNVSLLTCPFCGGPASCSHGYEPCSRHEHYEGDEIVCHTPPMCAMYCKTDLCPAANSYLGFASDLQAIQESGIWREPFLRAAAIWNRRADSASSEQT